MRECTYPRDMAIQHSLLTLGNESRVARYIVRSAKNQLLFGTDAHQTPKVRIRIWNGNYLEGAVLIKKWSSGRSIRVSNDLASIGNANQIGIRGVRIVQRGPLTVVKNEAVKRMINS